jgi:Zinc dependent phospholipase C
MPVEAIHVSAFSDSLTGSLAPARLRQGPLNALAKLGALVIDFPYFERFPLGVLRYLLKQPTAQSAWGDVLHKGTPVRAAVSMLQAARSLRAEGKSEQAERVLAFALGFVSHLAVDRSMHPLVNRMARDRSIRLGGDAAHHHTEIEKFHSVLFHEERLGFDFMGKPALREHTEVDAHAIHRDPTLSRAFAGALSEATSLQTSPGLLAGWARGYRQYVWLVSGPAGKRLVPEQVKELVRSELYQGSPFGDFSDAYAEAVARSRQALEAALAFTESADGEAAFARVLPEGPIDLD